MQLQWLAFLLCIGGLSAAQASMLESFLSMYPNSDVLAEQPSCANQIADLMLSMDYMFRQNRLKTPVKPEVIAFLTHFIYAGLISMAAVACYGWHKAASQRDAVEKQAAAREADLLKRCQGIKDQAFVLAEKLHLQSPAAGDHQHASTPGTMGDLQLQSPPAARHHMMMTPTKDTQEGPTTSAGATPPAPVSESSAPNLALLVAEASPARDTVGVHNSDQHCAPVLPGQALSAVKLPSTTPQDKPMHLQPPTPVSPGQAKAFMMPKHPSAGKVPQGQVSSPAGVYSPKGSPASTAPPGSVGPRVLPGGPVAVPVAGASPAAGAVTSASSGYHQQVPAAAPAQWTPPLAARQQPLAASCPPVHGAGTPGGPAPAQGAMPQSAGQLGAAMGQASTAKPLAAELPQQPLGWVNTSRGSGTPMPFNPMSPLQVQQQQFAGPAGMPIPGSSAGQCTPGTGSTTRSGGSLTHVHSVHSIAGSCGGSVPPFGGTPGSTTPWSASSAASGAGGASGSRGSGSLAPGSPYEEVMGKLDRLAIIAAQRKDAAKGRLAVMEREKAERQHTPSPGEAIRKSPV